MDLVLKSRGVELTDQIRRTVEHKLSKVTRHDPRVLRMEVEVIEERNPSIGTSHRVDVACSTGRRTFRAEGAGRDVGSALDQVAERLERQLTSYRGRLRARVSRGANRIKSRGTSQEGSPAPE